MNAQKTKTKNGVSGLFNCFLHWPDDCFLLPFKIFGVHPGNCNYIAGNLVHEMLSVRGAFFMKVVVVKSNKLLGGLLRLIFGIKKSEAM